MEGYNEAYVIWNSIIQQTISASGAHLQFPKQMDNGQNIPSPSDCIPSVLIRHVGELKGQLADWRASFSDSINGFHAAEYVYHYETHIDSVDPLKDPIGHLTADSPGTIIIGVIVVILIGLITVYLFSSRR